MPAMSADHETVTADPPTTFPTTRPAALAAWAEFLPRVPAYDAARNHVRPGHAAVSRLSPALSRRLLTEHELIAATLAAHPFSQVEKFVQELLWRRYWKSWLELRPSVWTDYRAAVDRHRRDLGGYHARRLAAVEAGRSGVAIVDHFADELRTTGYLHNHARMWFAAYWIHTERLPWALGADFFYRHLLDADPASNTLSWRWVAGIQTRGKPYLPRRANLEKYVDPALLAAHAAGLDRLDADAAPIDEPEPPRPAWPPDADDTALPPLPGRVGLWVHADDASAETATPLAALRPAAVFAAATDGSPASDVRRAYLLATARDALTRAGHHFAAPTTFVTGDPLPDALSAWAAAERLTAVVAVRPAVGPVLDGVPTVRDRLARHGIPLHLAWRPDDAHSLPWAESGYFNFWSRARSDLLGHPDPKDDRRRRRLRR